LRVYRKKLFKEEFYMKKQLKLLGLAAIIAVIVFTMAGCSDENEPGGNNPISKVYHLIATATPQNGQKIPIAISITTKGSSKSARAAVPGGNHDYSAQLGDVTLSVGTVNVSGNDYDFSPSGGGDGFSFNSDTGSFNGSIPIDDAVRAAISAKGFELVLPDAWEIDGVAEGKSDNYWNGTWRRTYYNDEYTGQRIVFNGANYTLTNENGSTETGTFVYCRPEPDSGIYCDSVFIFLRNVTSGPKIAAYLFEGGLLDLEGEDKGVVEFYNHITDPMDIGIDYYYEGDPEEYVRDFRKK
jgi:hypothetical protein